MSAPFNFRSSFNGFNREDVVQYIEYLNTNHSNQIKQLQADLAVAQKDSLLPEDSKNLVANMQEQFAQQEAVLTALNAEKDDLLSKCAQLEAALAALTLENKSLTEKAAQLEAQLTSKAVERESQITAQPVMSTYIEKELAAYRRAERVERVANERANAIYRRLHAALQETAAKTDQAVANMDSISDQFSAQINALKDALCDSKSYLDQTLCSLDELRPDPTEE